jgi:hypothetical protein
MHRSACCSASSNAIDCLTMIPQVSTRGTGLSNRTFEYASRVKPGKAAWQRGFRLKVEGYRANMVYLEMRLKSRAEYRIG